MGVERVLLQRREQASRRRCVWSTDAGVGRCCGRGLSQPVGTQAGWLKAPAFAPVSMAAILSRA